jgi:hypothetical protein
VLILLMKVSDYKKKNPIEANEFNIATSEVPNTFYMYFLQVSLFETL